MSVVHSTTHSPRPIPPQPTLADKGDNARGVGGFRISAPGDNGRLQKRRILKRDAACALKTDGAGKLSTLHRRAQALKRNPLGGQVPHDGAVAGLCENRLVVCAERGPALSGALGRNGAVVMNALRGVRRVRRRRHEKLAEGAGPKSTGPAPCRACRGASTGRERAARFGLAPAASHLGRLAHAARRTRVHWANLAADGNAAVAKRLAAVCGERDDAALHSIRDGVVADLRSHVQAPVKRANRFGPAKGQALLLLLLLLLPTVAG